MLDIDSFCLTTGVFDLIIIWGSIIGISISSTELSSLINGFMIDSYNSLTSLSIGACSSFKAMYSYMPHKTPQ
jgi:hypothetical protein